MDRNSELKKCMSVQVNLGFLYSPMSNGINERNHYSADITVKKILDVDRTLYLQKAVIMASRDHNTNVNLLGVDPLKLVTGKYITFSGITVGKIATESLFDSEAIMECHHEVTKEHYIHGLLTKTRI